MLVYLQAVETPEAQSLFEQIYKKYRSQLLAVAFSYLKNRSDAEDAVHQAFLYVAENLEKFSDGVCYKTRGYLVKVVECRAIDILRQRAKHPAADFYEHRIQDEQFYPGLSELASHMSRLPERYRNALILRFAYGFEYWEIARLMNTTEDAARMLVSRAKSKLEKICREEGML